jgi:TPR repeat protein
VATQPRLRLPGLPRGFLWAWVALTGLIVLAWAGYQRSHEADRRRTEEAEFMQSYGSVEAGRAAQAAQAAKAAQAAQASKEKGGGGYAATQAAAKRGDAVAQFELGQLFRDGKTDPPIDEPRMAEALRLRGDHRAAIWFRASAEQGYAPAQNELGLMYREGLIPSPEPLTQALSWFRQAADQGYAPAKINLGAMLARGLGVEKDIPRAIALLREVFEQGAGGAFDELRLIADRHAGATAADRAEAALVLGRAFLQGRGVARNETAAVEWFAKALKQGHAPARQWLNTTADGGDVVLQDILGRIYLGQEGVAKDETQAAAWFRKAAERGYAPAQNRLGAMYENGQGVAKDEAQARAWYDKAAAQGNLEGRYKLRELELRERNAAPLSPVNDIQPEVFEKAARAIWEQRNPSRADSSSSDSGSRLCVLVPFFPEPDARSKAYLPMAWHLDFRADGAPNPQREQALRQLNALARAGLLKKQDAALDIKGQTKPVTRYSLSRQGWAASGNQARSALCLTYGTARFLGVTRFEPRTIRTKDQAALQVIVVQAKVGPGSEADLAPWARDRELQAEFPDIGKSLDGKDFVVFLARRGEDLIDYLQAEKSRRHPQYVDQNDPALVAIRADMQRAEDGGDSFPPPTVDEIKQLLAARHGAGKNNPLHSDCLYLPGNSRLPVDKMLNQSGRYRPYAVAIFRNKMRAADDPVLKKTVPYLDLLERIGILRRRTETGVAGERGDAGGVFDADIYELAPDYVTLIDPQNTVPPCFPLGPPTVEFVDVQIFGNSYSSTSDVIFTYKLMMLFKNPPAWMTDRSLQNEWSELKGALENGRACDGRFYFNRRKREHHSGIGSC